MATTTVRIRVFDSRVHGLNAPGGEINRFARKITRETEFRAIQYCPTRSRALQRSIRSTVGWNALGVFGVVRAGAGHARYVHEGTYGPIVPRVAPYLRFEGWGPWAAGNSGPLGNRAWRLKWVKGQRAQPFLTRAMRDVLRFNRIL